MVLKLYRKINIHKSPRNSPKRNTVPIKTKIIRTIKLNNSH